MRFYLKTGRDFSTSPHEIPFSDATKTEDSSLTRLWPKRPTPAVLLACCMALLASQTHAAFGFKFDGTLDKEAISRSYFEGDFARVLPPLEMYRQTFNSTFFQFHLDKGKKTIAKYYLVDTKRLVYRWDVPGLPDYDGVAAVKGFDTTIFKMEKSKCEF